MYRIKLLWYYLETRYVKLLRFFGVERDSSVIPKGMYCYEYDEERNEKEPPGMGSYWVKTCKYYRSTRKSYGVACTYRGYYGFDPCLYDQCKICGENEQWDDDEEENEQLN